MYQVIGGSSSRSATRFADGARSSSPSPSTSLDISSASRSASPSLAISPRDAQPTPTTMQFDPTFRSTFGEIIGRWRENILSDADLTYLQNVSLSLDDYRSLTDEFNLRHGVELVENRIILREYPTIVQEVLAGALDYWVLSTYPRQDIVNFRSASAVCYSPGLEKQPDASFRPRHLPDPSRNNGLMFQPGTMQHYPSFVFEVAVTNEDRERLLTDASDKYFEVHTSVQCWLGVKVDITPPQGQEGFWCGWGRRGLTGRGLRLVQQSEDGNGAAAYLPVHAPAALVRQLHIPSPLIYHPLPVPPNVPANLVIAHEDIRREIFYGISQM